MTTLPETAAEGSATALADALLAAPGITGVHLLRGRTADSSGPTAEKALRDRPDAVAEWVLLIEAIDADAIRAGRGSVGSNDALRRAGFGALQRGIYAFQFGLVASEGVQA